MWAQRHALCKLLFGHLGRARGTLQYSVSSFFFKEGGVFAAKLTFVGDAWRS
jgi:hypothetical protein